MVRRWSYINKFNFFFRNRKLKFFKKFGMKRIFKLTVSTRKFFKKYTKFRRKAFNRLRHKNNWMIYSNIFKFWSFDYLTTKFFYKKYWLSLIYRYNFLIFDWSSVKNTNIDYFYNYSYNITNYNSFLFKNNLKYNFFKNISFNFFFDNFKNSSLASIEKIDLENQEEFNALVADNQIYDRFESFSENDFSLEFFYFNENYIFDQLLNIYKFLIYLSLKF